MLSSMFQNLIYVSSDPNSMTKGLGTDRHVEDNIKFIKTLDKFFTDKQLHETFRDEFRTCVLYHKKYFF